MLSRSLLVVDARFAFIECTIIECKRSNTMIPVGVCGVTWNEVFQEFLLGNVQQKCFACGTPTWLIYAQNDLVFRNS